MKSQSKICKVNSKILYNKSIRPGYFVMGLEAKEIAESAKPGQFLHIRCSDGFSPLLRRPFSIHSIKAEGSKHKIVEILYEVIGKGTGILSRKKAGDFLDILGPFGNGFIYPSSIIHHPSSILIAGGMGVAPLVFLAERLIPKINPSTMLRVDGERSRTIKVIVLIGAKTRRLILCERDFKELGAKVHIATDDGSYGFKGFVSELFKQKLSAISHKPSAIYACGPNQMLESVSEICRERNVNCQVSLEENITCGLGACLGCVVETTHGYKRVCKDGPVFKAEEVLWDG